ncbi:hypothetical protein BH20CHL6_BH20CHL6_06790 [soil metagenome]
MSAGEPVGNGLVVGIVAPRYPPAIGGVERHAQLLARGLTRLGITVEVLTVDPEGKLPPLERDSAVTVRRFPGVGKSSTYIVSAAMGAWLWRNASRYTVVHAHSYHTPVALVAALAARRAGVPFVLTAHYHGTGHSPLRRALHIPYRPLGSWMVRQASMVICVSAAEQTLMVRDFGAQVPTTVIHNAVDISGVLSAEPWPREPGAAIVLAVGRLEPYKQADRLVSALAHLPETVRLVIVGTGAARSAIEETARRLGVDGRVDMLGSVSDGDLARWYRTADVYATLSQHEAFGLTVLEGAAAGCALVVSDIPAHREVATLLPPGRITMVAPTATPPQLGALLRHALASGRNAPAAPAEMPSTQRMAEQTLAAYEAVVRSPPTQLAEDKLPIGLPEPGPPSAAVDPDPPASTGSEPSLVGRPAPILGRLPAIAAIMGVGIFLMSIAYARARLGAADASILYWASLLTIFVPAAARLLAPVARRAERLGLVVLLGLGLYTVKVLHSPLFFTLADELQHWRTATDILGRGALFTQNSILEISPFYPGLENAATALVALSGLPVFEAGIILIGIARVLFTLALFHLFEVATGSTRAAGVACLIYMANPSFLYFDAQFVYESLALPLAVGALFLVRRRLNAPAASRIALTLVMLLAIGAVVVTHHATSALLAVFLWMWYGTSLVMRRRRGSGRGPLGPALIATVAGAAWVAYVAGLTLSYLGPYAGNALSQFVRFLTGDLADRTLFRNAAGVVTPPLEQYTGFLGVGLLLLALPVGLFLVWRRRREETLMVVLALVAAAYPVSLALRLTAGAQEVAARASPWLFLGLAPVIALALTETSRLRTPSWTVRALLTAVLAVVFSAGVVVGFPVYARMPGPYLVGADSRSVEPESISAAQWMLEQLGPDNRVTGDRTNRLLLGSYGQQDVVTAFTAGANISALYLSPGVGPDERRIMEQGDIAYLIVDRRLSRALPAVGAYFERAEVVDGPHREPIPASVLSKFDEAAGLSRIFDSGELQIYRVEAQVGAP